MWGSPTGGCEGYCPLGQWGTQASRSQPPPSPLHTEHVASKFLKHIGMCPSSTCARWAGGRGQQRGPRSTSYCCTMWTDGWSGTHFEPRPPKAHKSMKDPFLVWQLTRTDLTLAEVAPEKTRWKFIGLKQGCTNPGRLAAVATKLCTVAPNVCGSSVWELFHVSCLVPRILKWLLDVCIIYAPLG
jgi:hypothetical protein